MRNDHDTERCGPPEDDRDTMVELPPFPALPVWLEPYGDAELETREERP